MGIVQRAAYLGNVSENERHFRNFQNMIGFYELMRNEEHVGKFPIYNVLIY